MKTLLLILFPILSLADWQVGLGTGSYLGAVQLQTQWENENRNHRIQLSYGWTRDSIVKEIRQYSGAYLWSPTQIIPFQKTVWSPFLLGPFVTYTDNPYYYFKSPERYNNEHYYDVNSLRWGARFATELTLPSGFSRPLHFALEGSLLEKALFTYFNNPKELDIFKYYWSLGFSIRMDL